MKKNGIILIHNDYKEKEKLLLELLEYAQNHNISINREIFFCKNNLSLMMEELKKEYTTNCILITIENISRISRYTKEIIAFIETMNAAGIEVVIPNIDSHAYLMDLHLSIERLERLLSIPLPENSEYTDPCDNVDESVPKLLNLKPLDKGRTAMIMSDGKEYYLIDDEMSEMMALDFCADKCRVSDNGRKIIMDDDDRQFPVADIANFMYALPTEA